MALFSSVRKMVGNYYDTQAAADINTCHVGAWVIYRENYLTKRKGGLSMKAFFKRVAGKTEKTRANDAPPVMENAACDCKNDECKILIVCKGPAFSRGIADYAVNMAKKTRSSLVALNVDESNGNFEGFRSNAQSSIEYFSTRAAGADITFSHEIRQGDEKTVVAQMHEADPRFRYVMDDSAVVCNSRRSIPVYTRATMRAK